jgi:uncharacterized Zn finger protein (UPF0148 family)
MELKEFACPNCKAPLTPVEGARYMFCDYCGTRIVIDDIEYYREDSKTERERIRADKEVRKSSVEKDAEVEIQRLKNEDNRNDVKMLLVILSFFVLAGLFLLIMSLTLG